MKIITRLRSISFRRNLSIIIAWVLIIALSLSIQNITSVKADLPGPYCIYGYIDNSTNQDIPSGITVTATNIDNNNNSGTTTTGAQGSFSINVGKDSGFDCSNGHQIVINCSYNGEVGENITTIDTGETFVWCNLTGGKRLEPTNISINVTPWAWDAGKINYNSYNSTSNTSFNLSNKGNIKINVRIHGYNVSWDSNYWNLTSAVGPNNYTFAYQKEGGSSWTLIGLTNSSFVSNLQYNSEYFSYTYWKKFGLNISMPTSSSPLPPGELNATVRFWSIEA